MGGLYQKLLRLEEGVAHLTADGRTRLKGLEARFGPKTKATATA